VSQPKPPACRIALLPSPNAVRRQTTEDALGTELQLVLVAAVTLTLSIAPILALAGGIAILVWPKFLNYIVAGYLIVVGVTGLFNL
jgi:hypothetical protein